MQLFGSCLTNTRRTEVNEAKLVKLRNIRFYAALLIIAQTRAFSDILESKYQIDPRVIATIPSLLATKLGIRSISILKASSISIRIELTNPNLLFTSHCQLPKNERSQLQKIIIGLRERGISHSEILDFTEDRFLRNGNGKYFEDLGLFLTRFPNLEITQYTLQAISRECNYRLYRPPIEETEELVLRLLLQRGERRVPIKTIITSVKTSYPVVKRVSKRHGIDMRTRERIS